MPDRQGPTGVAGSKPVVPTNTGRADAGLNTRSVGFSGYAPIFMVGDRAELGTIWEPVAVEEGGQRFARSGH